MRETKNNPTYSFVGIILGIFLLGIWIFVLMSWGCSKGSFSTGVPLYYSVEFKTAGDDKIVHLLDRNIAGLELDVRQPGMATLTITAMDRMQIGNKIHDIPWKISIHFQENSNLKILK